ncbi:MAG: tRNA guanosine(34) transglycosylase Tgt [Parcubacteria group bacterium]|nr:tRNA guanosine(34) transglycosylase Tgt [Parcubacteria group bacterium]
MSRPEFKILKKSTKSRARLGVIKTKHGVMKTPALFPVATKAVVKTLDSEDIRKIGFEGVLANTYHLMLQPGSDLIKKQGGLHKFMNFNGVIATDSGGFQVFSLGKGLTQSVGKLGTGRGQGCPCPLPVPSLVKIREEGVWFRSHLDGSEHFLSPEKSMKIQQELGADIIFAFDECSSPLDDKKQTEKAMQRTHNWAERCIKAFKDKTSAVNKQQWLFGIVQGGKYKKFREKSAKFIGELDFDGFGIGGSFGEAYGDLKKNMLKVLDITIPLLPEEKPRHLLGIGYLEDLELTIKKGIDLFDCVHPTRMARHGIAFTSQGKLSISKAIFLKDKDPIDKKCSCPTCQNYSRAYICHLFRAKEITAMRLLTIHNLFFIKNFIENIRERIQQDKI